MNAKKYKVLDNKKGWVEIGSLSKNELCRGVKDLMDEGQQTKARLDLIQMVYMNHLASLAACEVVYK
jgi:hypothetical protein